MGAPDEGYERGAELVEASAGKTADANTLTLLNQFAVARCMVAGVRGNPDQPQTRESSGDRCVCAAPPPPQPSAVASCVMAITVNLAGLC